jgi:exodeoxyribonuclease-3
LFKLTSLNLNGIRSAATKGVEAWLEQHAPDCICVQEVKAQAPDLAGRFEVLAGMQGHFHLPRRRATPAWASTRATSPATCHRLRHGRVRRRGRYVELRFDTPRRQFSVISCYFPSGSSGRERQQAKFRFLDGFYPALQRLKAEREFILCGDVNIAHQEIDLKNWKSNQKNSGFLPEERAWMTRVLTRRPGGRVPPPAARDHRRGLHLVEQPRPGLRQERGLAAGLPPGHARHGGQGTPRGDLQGRSSPTTRRSRSSTT